MCVISAHVRSLPRPVYGGCALSSLTSLVSSQVAPGAHITRWLEVAYKLAYRAALEHVFQQLRLVWLPESRQWVAALVVQPDDTFMVAVQAVIGAFDDNVPRNKIVSFPLVRLIRYSLFLLC